MATGQEKAIEEMITLLEGYVKQFDPPIDVNGRPLKDYIPETIKVRGLNVTKQELAQMLDGYKKQLSALKKTGAAPEITLDNGLLLNPITPKSATTTTIAPVRIATSTTTTPGATATTTPGATATTIPGATTTTSPGMTPSTAPASVTAPQASTGTPEEQLAEYEYWVAEYSKAESTLGKLLAKPKDGKIILDGKSVSIQEANLLLGDLVTTKNSYDDLAKPLRKSRQDQQRKAEQIKTPGFTSSTEYRNVLQKRYEGSLNGDRSYGTPAEIYSEIENFDQTYSSLAPKPLPVFQPTQKANITQLAQMGVSPTSMAAAPGRVLTAAESKAAATGRFTPSPTGGGPTGGGPTGGEVTQKVVPTGAVSPDKITAQLELRGLTDTPENRKMIRQELVKQPGLSSDWKERFVAEYPQYAQYLTDPMYGDDVTQVFQRAMEEQWFKYGDVGLSVFARELGKTAYGLKTNSTQKAFDAKTMADQNKSISDQLDLIRSTYGNLGQNGDTPGLSDQELFNLARESARNGYTNEQQKRAIYSYVYNADPTADRTAVVARIEAGKVGQDVNKIYNDYLLAPDKSAIKRYATGEITLEDVKREARALTSEMYPALKRLIDQGVSVKAISDQYAATAGTILEQDDTTINMADTQYRVAFSAKDAAGNPSLMSLGDWQTMLKTNADYGWQYTKAANSQALDTATMIARTFGKVQ